MKRILFTLSVISCVIVIPGKAQEFGNFTDARDGQVYDWVQIGSQTWMAENLAYLPKVNYESDSKYEGACYYVYGYDGINLSEAKGRSVLKKYGALYNWDGANVSCPEGWHLPTDQEWKELEEYLAMGKTDSGKRGWRSDGDVGKKLKSVSEWNEDRGADEIGFHALPGGCRGYDGFESMEFCAYFWTASPSNDDNGWRRGFCGDDMGSSREEERRHFGLSVRCVKDK